MIERDLERTPESATPADRNQSATSSACRELALCEKRQGRLQRAIDFLSAVSDRAEIKFQSPALLKKSFDVNTIIEALSSGQAVLLNDITCSDSAQGVMSDAFLIDLFGEQVVLKIPGACGGALEKGGELELSAAAAMFHLHPETLLRHHGRGNHYLPECHALGVIQSPLEGGSEAGSLEEGFVFVIEEYVKGMSLGKALSAELVSLKQAEEALHVLVDYFYDKHDCMWDHRISDAILVLGPNGEPKRTDNGMIVLRWIDGGAFYGTDFIDREFSKRTLSENAARFVAQERKDAA